MASLITIKRQKGTVYQIRYRLDGWYHKTPVLPVSKREAELLKMDIEHRLGKHKAGLEKFLDPTRQNPKSQLITSYAEWFFKNKKTAIRRGTPIKKRTKETYVQAFKFLVDAIGNKPISEIKKKIPDIEEALNKYPKPSSRSIILRSLKAAWNFGVSRDYIESSPFLKIENPKVNHTPETYTLEEIHRIYNNVETDEGKVALGLAFYGGLRREEICRNSTWEKDVDWENQILNLPHAKTGTDQKIVIFPELLEILQAYKKNEGFLVPRHPHTITHILTEAKLKAGIKKKGSVHIFRHSIGKILRERGCDIRDIQDHLRHSSVITTMHYTQTDLKHLKERLLKNRV